MNKYSNEQRIEFNIGDCRVTVSMLGGFFNLREAQYRSSTVHSHPGYEVHAVIEGEGILAAEGESYTARGKEILLVPPGAVHRAFIVKDGIKTSFSFTLAKERRSAQGIYERITKLLSSDRGIVKLSDGGKYIDYLERIFYEFYSEKIYSKERLRSLYRLFITDLLYDLGETSTAGTGGTEERRESETSVIHSVMEEYVTVNFNKTPSLSELARSVHLGERQTARVFREYFRESFSEYVSRARVDMAKYYLVRSDKSPSEIATEVGYLSYNGFFKLFKNKTGQSPEEYRKIHKEKK